MGSGSGSRLEEKSKRRVFFFWRGVWEGGGGSFFLQILNYNYITMKYENK